MHAIKVKTGQKMAAPLKPNVGIQLHLDLSPVKEEIMEVEERDGRYTDISNGKPVNVNPGTSELITMQAREPSKHPSMVLDDIFHYLPDESSLSADDLAASQLEYLLNSDNFEPLKTEGVNFDQLRLEMTQPEMVWPLGAMRLLQQHGRPKVEHLKPVDPVPSSPPGTEKPAAGQMDEEMGEPNSSQTGNPQPSEQPSQQQRKNPLAGIKILESTMYLMQPDGSYKQYNTSEPMTPEMQPKRFREIGLEDGPLIILTGGDGHMYYNAEDTVSIDIEDSPVYILDAEESAMNYVEDTIGNIHLDVDSLIEYLPEDQDTSMEPEGGMPQKPVVLTEVIYPPSGVKPMMPTDPMSAPPMIFRTNPTAGNEFVPPMMSMPMGAQQQSSIKVEPAKRGKKRKIDVANRQNATRSWEMK
ncbi:hypothetical protein KR018_008280 [Drosophila ironensis]|nr:hypothetical protein KR018_008280 [Drosophila ironensis]